MVSQIHVFTIVIFLSRFHISHRVFCFLNFG